MRGRSTLLGLSTLLVASVVSAATAKDVYKKAGPAVVLILGSDDGKAGSGGTGSIITAQGMIVTNAHVVVNESTGAPYKILYVFLKPPKITGDNARDLANRYKARVLAFSGADELDLAVLQMESAPPSLPTIAFGNPDDVEVGEEVVAIGHPEMGGLWTLTTGTISTVIANFNRVKGKDVFQTEASVNRGNSGGPLLDLDGNMVAINTLIARQGAGGVAITGVNFSLKSSVAVKWLAGQGMGLAYAPRAEEPMVVAVAPEANAPATRGTALPPAAAAPPPPVANPTAVAPAAPPPPAAVAAPPPATIVVAEKPPAKPENLRVEAQQLAKGPETEKMTAGKAFDPKKAKPKVLTEKRPYNLDDLRKQQMKELEDMMIEMRGKVQEKKQGNGMGLW
ncbi:MAG: trypsin-like peptidase domain-containing protein [Deltaproteobacteria bacterium]|nr:trypsin-like peptidase domain-containing protein [Deltaproteobacteria bacterium]